MSTRSWDARQRQAIDSGAQNLLITAPPGCGKTDVLAYRAETLIPSLQPGQRILALTFSTKAKENLQARLTTVLGPAAMRRYVTVRNYHGHALELARAHARTIGVAAHELMPPSKARMRAMEKRIAQRMPRLGRYAFGDALDELRALKLQPVTDEQLLADLAAAGRDLALGIEIDRREEKELHFPDLLRLAQLVLRVDAVAVLYQHHYGAVLVDEFQDLTPQQLDVILRTCRQSRTFAGDLLQGIYSWAGSAPIEVAHQLNRICSEHVSLNRSYRSSPAVLDAVNAVAGDLGAPEPLVSHDPGSWTGGGFAAAVRFRDELAEAESIAGIAIALRQTRPDWSLGVITRADWRAREVREAFDQYAVDLLRWDMPLDSPEVNDILRGALPKLPRGASVNEASEYVLDHLITEDPDLQSDVEAALEALAGTEAVSYRAALATMRSHNDTQPVQAGAHLLTAHKGKGHQFDWVVVLGLEEGHLPGKRSRSVEALREEEQVLLVMLSRARHGVLVTRREWAPDSSGQPRRVVRSRWSDLLVRFAHADVKAAIAHIEGLQPD